MKGELGVGGERRACLPSRYYQLLQPNYSGEWCSLLVPTIPSPPYSIFFLKKLGDFKNHVTRHERLKRLI